MASINMGSILAKAQAHMGSGAGQAKVSYAWNHNFKVRR